MNFALSDEQDALKDAVKDFLSSKSGFDVVRSAISENNGVNLPLFKSMCDEIGLSSLVIEESFGGYGASDAELCIAVEQHGYFLAPTPLIAHSFATMLIQECAEGEAKQMYLPSLVSGDAIATLVLEDDTLENIEINGENVNGEIERVIFGNVANLLFLVFDKNLYCIDLKQDAVAVTSQNSLDQTCPFGKVSFNNAKIEKLSAGDISKGYSYARARMTTLLSNEMLGVSCRAFDMALEYSKEREQFGKAIGSFQAIKHTLAELYVHLEEARSLCLYAANLAGQHDEKLPEAAMMAKYFMNKLANKVTRENIQIHGGIGFTFEHDAHLLLKRAIFSSFQLKDTQGCADDIFQNITDTSTK